MSKIDRLSEIDRIVASAGNAHTADTEGFTGWSRANLIALAQVHATVALAEAQESSAMAATERLLEALRYGDPIGVHVSGRVVSA